MSMSFMTVFDSKFIYAIMDMFTMRSRIALVRKCSQTYRGGAHVCRICSFDRRTALRRTVRNNSRLRNVPRAPFAALHCQGEPHRHAPHTTPLSAGAT